MNESVCHLLPCGVQTTHTHRPVLSSPFPRRLTHRAYNSKACPREADFCADISSLFFPDTNSASAVPPPPRTPPELGMPRPPNPGVAV